MIKTTKSKAALLTASALGLSFAQPVSAQEADAPAADAGLTDLDCTG